MNLRSLPDDLESFPDKFSSFPGDLEGFPGELESFPNELEGWNGVVRAFQESWKTCRTLRTAFPKLCKVGFAFDTI